MLKKNSPVSSIPKDVISVLNIPSVGRPPKSHKGSTIGKLAKRAGCTHPYMRSVLIGIQKVKATKAQRALKVIIATYRKAKRAKKKPINR